MPVNEILEKQVIIEREIGYAYVIAKVNMSACMKTNVLADMLVNAIVDSLVNLGHDRRSIEVRTVKRQIGE